MARKSSSKQPTDPPVDKPPKTKKPPPSAAEYFAPPPAVETGTRVPLVVESERIDVLRDLVTVTDLPILVPSRYADKIVRLRPGVDATDEDIRLSKAALADVAASVIVFPRPKGAVIPDVSKLAVVAVPSLREAVEQAAAAVVLPEQHRPAFNALIQSIAAEVRL
jgi:hypothetical protein